LGNPTCKESTGATAILGIKAKQFAAQIHNALLAHLANFSESRLDDLAVGVMQVSATREKRAGTIRGKDPVASNLGFQLIFGLHMVCLGNISNTILSGSREKHMRVFLDSFQDLQTWGNVTNTELDLVDLFRGCLLGLGKR
jgi:hypothetical protein